MTPLLALQSASQTGGPFNVALLGHASMSWPVLYAISIIWDNWGQKYDPRCEWGKKYDFCGKYTPLFSLLIF